ncbi:hypothetical protein TYRP_006498 [Tyrophagus putrescentiae]|nr:hypothetical protein TYRP_006498 [Tyrophagus putrescentiae]
MKQQKRAPRQGIESALPESVFSQKSPKLLFEPRQAKQSRQSRAKIKSIEPFGARSLKYPVDDVDFGGN